MGSGIRVQRSGPRWTRCRRTLTPRTLNPEPCRPWLVSDFSFEQSAAFARTWLPAGQLPAFLDHCESSCGGRLARPGDRTVGRTGRAVLARVGRRGRACERQLTAEQLERIRLSVIEQAGRPELGPVLRPTGDTEAVFARHWPPYKEWSSSLKPRFTTLLFRQPVNVWYPRSIR